MMTVRYLCRDKFSFKKIYIILIFYKTWRRIMLCWNVVLILFTMSIMSKTQTWSEVAQLAVHDGRRGVRLGRPSGILAAALCDGISGWR